MTESRSRQIIDYLKQHNLVTVNELVKLTGFSPATIRRELVKLDAEGVIYRVHGGVTLHRFVADQPTTSQKEGSHTREKAAIAEEAIKLIKPGDAVVLDAGTTTIQIARGILHMPLRVITNDLRIGLLLAEYQQIETSITGGTVDWSSQSCIGPHATELLETIHPTMTFVSCNAFSTRNGITAPTFEKAYMKRTLLHQSGRTILVADSSKYDLTQLFEVGPLTDLDMIITDKGLNAEAAEEIRRMGVDLRLC